MHFASDNWAGAHPRIVEAIARAADGYAPAYGHDSLTRRVEERLAELFEREVAVFLVATGTAANALALSAFARPGGVAFCHRDAHVLADECGAPDFLGGIRLKGLSGALGKLEPAELERATGPYDSVHGGQGVAVSISQLTEFGAAWTADEIAAVAAVARRHGLALHMDGARFANAVAALGASPAALSWQAGVDVLSFGATKGGCIGAEAVVFFDPAAAVDFGFLRKRAGHLLSKSRFVAAQLDAFLDGGLWLDLARHANRMASELAEGIAAAGGRLAGPPQANEVFAIVPRPTAERLRAAGARFYEWGAGGLSETGQPGPDEVLVRLVASFSTTKEEVAAFVKTLG